MRSPTMEDDFGLSELRRDRLHAGARRSRAACVPDPSRPLREQMREVMRFLHYSRRTEETYWQWTVRGGKGAKDRVTIVPETLRGDPGWGVLWSGEEGLPSAAWRTSKAGRGLPDWAAWTGTRKSGLRKGVGWDGGGFRSGRSRGGPPRRGSSRVARIPG